jgi:hypothetical protein
MIGTLPAGVALVTRYWQDRIDYKAEIIMGSVLLAVSACFSIPFVYT